MAQVIAEATAANPQNRPIIQKDAIQPSNEGSTLQQAAQILPSRKRIGPYSYRLTDVIGSGFSSVVYRGYKDNDHRQLVALKVVKIVEMKEHRRNMLENEVRVLKLVQHPNIIQFVDLYYTRNNYYIITEYCQGGSLQSLIDRNQGFDWAEVSYRMGLACRYLAENRIMHRDIKPANILLKNGICKLSDFGFAYQFQKFTVLRENYLIGSPLYMPIQSLRDHEYSSKNDSFALGVCIYYLIARRFPWKGRNKEELLNYYSKKNYNRKTVAYLPPKVKHLLAGLLEMKPQKRLHLSECDFEVFLHVGPTLSIPQQLAALQGKYTQQLKLCQYIHSLYNNYDKHFLQVNAYLPEYLAQHLQSITARFGWQKHQGLQKVKESYPLPEKTTLFASDQYYWLNNCLKDAVRVLAAREDSKASVMLQKLLNYQEVVEAIIGSGPERILACINQLVIHADYLKLRPETDYIVRRMTNIDFYQL